MKCTSPIAATKTVRAAFPNFSQTTLEHGLSLMAAWAKRSDDRRRPEFRTTGNRKELATRRGENSR